MRNCLALVLVGSAVLWTSSLAKAQAECPGHGDQNLAIDDPCRLAGPCTERIYSIRDQRSIDAFQRCECAQDLLIQVTSSEQELSLDCTTSLSGHVKTNGSNTITSLSMNRLRTVGAELEIRHADAMKTMDFSSLVSVEGDVIINENDVLEAIDLFTSLRRVEGSLSIWKNDAMTLIDLPELEQVGGNVLLKGSALETMRVPKLFVVGGCLDISYQKEIQNLERFSSLTRVGRLDVYNNNALTSTAGLSALRAVGGRVYFNRNGQLLTIEGFDALEQVEGELEIKRNPVLEGVDIPALRSIGKKLTIVGNNKLDHVELPLVESVGNKLVVEKNPALHAIALTNLRSVNGDLVLTENEALASVDLSGLTEVEGTLRIDHNSSLTSIEDLRNLQRVGGNIEIHDNAALCQQRVVEIVGAIQALGEVYVGSNTGPCEQQQGQPESAGGS